MPPRDLGAVYTALLTLETEDHERLARGDLPDRELRHLSALAQLNRHQRLVLLGEPGSGKSTFVNFVAMCLAGEALGHDQADLALLTAPLPDEKGDDGEERQPWGHGPLLPVRVVLREYVAEGLLAGKGLWDFLRDRLSGNQPGTVDLSWFADHLRETLRRKPGGLLILDGLDEVPEENRMRVQLRDAVHGFCDTFPDCRVLVTARPYAYQDPEGRLEGFEIRHLVDFSEEQIEEVAEDPPTVVGEAFEVVSQERVTRYLDEATEQALQRLQEYLGS